MSDIVEFKAKPQQGPTGMIQIAVYLLQHGQPFHAFNVSGMDRCQPIQAAGRLLKAANERLVPTAF